MLISESYFSVFNVSHALATLFGHPCSHLFDIPILNTRVHFPEHRRTSPPVTSLLWRNLDIYTVLTHFNVPVSDEEKDRHKRCVRTTNTKLHHTSNVFRFLNTTCSDSLLLCSWKSNQHRLIHPLSTAGIVWNETSLIVFWSSTHFTTSLFTMAMRIIWTKLWPKSLWNLKQFCIAILEKDFVPCFFY